VRPDTYREINNFYTATIYEKGAEVVRMLKTMLGAKRFRAGMDLYFARHDGEAATVEQFVRCFSDVSDLDMPQFMRWYSQAGTPEVVVNGQWDASKKTYRLDVAQSVPPTPGQPMKEPMLIPLAIGLVGSEGSDLPLTLADGSSIPRGVLTLSKPAEVFEFSGVAERPRLSLNRNFSAPINLVANLSPRDLSFLAAHDSDPFNRWQALQTLATTILVNNVAAVRQGANSAPSDGLVDALTEILADARLEPALIAQAMTLPAEADIAREIGRDIDPDAIFAARKQLRAAIAQRLGPTLADTYERMISQQPYRPDAVSAGRRSLKNVCLDLLAATGKPDAIERAARQYQAANNMTDRMAALHTLSLYDTTQRTQAIEDFYQRYADDPLILDKWFSLQAAIPEAATLERVRALTTHPAFSFANPNRVRALIGSFAQGNPTQFNRADGKGYDFIAENVLALDAKNPQVAARLLSAFKSWRGLEPIRRAAAEAALRHIAAASGVSRDVSDIIQRTLAEPD
jgi:aminopeptidase N